MLHEYRGPQADDSNNSRQDADKRGGSAKQNRASAIPARQPQSGPEVIPQATASPAQSASKSSVSRGPQPGDSNGSEADAKTKGTDSAAVAPDTPANAQEVLPLAAKIPVAQDQNTSQDDSGDSQGNSSQSDDSKKHAGASQAAAVYARSREMVSWMPALPAAQGASNSADSAPAQLQSAIPVAAALPSTEVESDTSAPAAGNAQPERAATLPMIEDSKANPPASTGPIAIAAKLTPAEAPATDAPAADAPPADAGDGRSHGQNTLQKQAAAAVLEDPGVKVSADPAPEHFMKAEPAFTPPAPAGSSAIETTAAGKSATGAGASMASQAATQMQPLIEMPAQPQGSGHDITIKLPDASERGMDVRFVERGGEVHVAIRTSDGEMAQTLRSGLNDFVGRMDHAGIRAEVWRPGAEASSSQQDATRQQTQDQKGSRNQSGSQDSESDSQNSKKPRWVQAMEDSIGSPATTSPAGGHTV